MGSPSSQPMVALLAALLYFKPGISSDTAREAMDPRKPWSKATLQSRISELRNRLGTDPDGNPFLPRDRTGTYRLSPTTRWTSFEEYYDHPGDEFLYVVHGAIEVEVDLMGPDGRELHRLHAGDSLLYPGGTPHRWRVLTEEQDPSGVHVLTVQNAPR
ncbi:MULTISPECIES: cupin domain-containing protein [unclassified Streptomyces]|uniref:cupin domain-containing protein n=1 Tax=Streptomyces sp. NPDC058441 TaxID=3346502 RepID=UPI003651BBE4